MVFTPGQAKIAYAGAVEAAIELHDVEVRYGRYVALDDVGLTVPRGAFVAVVGPNGAGKSTLLRVILGLIRPRRGEVRLFGRPIHEVPSRWFGFVPQFKTLDRSFPALGLELVVSGLRRRWPLRVTMAERERALAALRQVQGTHLVDRPLSGLSGGELQRLYLARAFVREPRLLLLDEPATGMDALGESDMYRMIEAFQSEQGATVMMITHDWDAAYHHATHVLVLNRRVIGFGPPSVALSERCLRRAFGHTGHAHGAILGQGGRDD